ncbi:hypothetical protein KMW28_24835 [Flammeovirga yaeyamensis]|uniref:Uncharacterized protein n=1 Tax=Flammeovirga yaeyamensis TaxID=367791 RepID=A0AAX1N970_9BACT|nr:hypothetical protein [Flammeovirga yaeyamensis]MBB3699484.1 hypothetical protein [Flammeovirga yaeyamensis]NMF35259.1 hypothetical protein [Flammeovirga yaeyamensis]QWG04119.1 hypothetical protein KMW28_24835 [Flammeovirga yaeyamensis]
MKALLLILFSLLFIQTTYSQVQLEISNPQKGKVKYIQEFKKVKVKLIDGRVIKGPISFYSENDIYIKDEIILLSDIRKIKRNPRGWMFLQNAPLIAFGGTLSLVALSMNSYNGESTTEMVSNTIPFAVIFVAGIISPNFFKGYNRKKGWNYKIIRN